MLFENFQEFINQEPELKQKRNILNGICEQWGEFYAKLEIEGEDMPFDNKMDKFGKFITLLREDYLKGSFSKNPIHYLKEADKNINENNKG